MESRRGLTSLGWTAPRSRVVVPSVRMTQVSTLEPDPKVVEDTGQDGALDEVDGLGLRHALGPAGLKDRHGGERTGAHGGVGEPVSCGFVWMEMK